jgi:ribosomal-protein-alanine N-acetyltransferase
VIRHARLADLDTVLAIERAGFADPWAPGDFHDALAGGVLFFVAAVNDVVAGYVMARHVADEGEILNLAVAPAYQGRGLGRELVEHVLTRLSDAGVAAVYLEVRESNAVARRLYEHLGFQEVGRRARYYQRPMEDAVILRAAILAVRGDAKL